MQEARRQYLEARAENTSLPSIPASELPDWALICRPDGTPAPPAPGEQTPGTTYPPAVREWLAHCETLTIPRAVWLTLLRQSPTTTTHVNICIVKPATKGRGGCYALKVLQVQSPGMVGRPTVFASHAWRYRFSSFVAAVEVAMGELKRERAAAGLPPRTEYIWNDIFVEDQNSAAAKPDDYWFNGFKTAVETIGRTVLVLFPWNEPIVLTRAW